MGIDSVFIKEVIFSKEKLSNKILNCDDETLFSGSITYSKDSHVFFSFVNKESLSYILNDLNVESGVKVEITRHDESAEGIQFKENKLPNL